MFVVLCCVVLCCVVLSDWIELQRRTVTCPSNVFAYRLLLECCLLRSYADVSLYVLAYRLLLERCLLTT